MPRLVLTISPQAETALRWLTRRGLYGKNRAAVARTMLYDRIRAYYTLEHVPAAPRRKRRKIASKR